MSKNCPLTLLTGANFRLILDKIWLNVIFLLITRVSLQLHSHLHAVSVFKDLGNQGHRGVTKNRVEDCWEDISLPSRSKAMWFMQGWEDAHCDGHKRIQQAASRMCHTELEEWNHGKMSPQKKKIVVRSKITNKGGWKISHSLAIFKKNFEI